MIPSARFTCLEAQRQTLLQPGCPVYVHCTRRSVERDSGTVLLQVRMVNCGEREIRTVYLRVEGLNFCGQMCYQVRELPLVDCAAAPRAVFGEERLLVLPRTEVASLRITVERVVFADGTLWRRKADARPFTVAEAGWTSCGCGMPNPPRSERCLLCGRTLASAQEPLPAQSLPPVGLQTAVASERPAPIVRHFTPSYWGGTEEFTQPESEAPRWLTVLLYIFGAAAILAAVAFLVFCLILFH